MRGWWPLIASVAALLAAWVADRLLAEAVTNAGMYAGDHWSDELLVAADRIPKLVILGLLGWIAVEFLRRGAARAVALLLLVAGLAMGVLPTLVLLARYEPLAPFVAQELFWPRQFVMWTASGLLVIGIVGALGAPWRFGARPWVRAVAAVGLIAVCWPADALLSDLFIGAAEGRTVEAMLIFELLVRTSVLVALFVLCAMTLDTARSAGGAVFMTMIGAVVFIGFALLALALPQPAGPGEAAPAIVTGYFARWMSAGVMLIGLWELVMIRRGAVARDATATDRSVVAT